MDAAAPVPPACRGPSAPSRTASSASRTPALSFSPETLLRAQGRGGGVRAAILDVDGVMTDGRLYIGETGEAFKAFHVLDGHGLKLLARAGIAPLVVTGRDSAALRRRLADLGLADAAFGAADKLAAAQPLLDARGIAWDDVAAIGDDWPDLPLLERAAFSAAPPGAHAEVLARVDHVTAAPGGAGCVREFCDLLLLAAGRYGALLRGDGDGLGSTTLDGR